MNEENERELRVEEVTAVDQDVAKIGKAELRRALKRMKNGKAAGPDNIPVELWKCLYRRDTVAVDFLTSSFNIHLESGRMLSNGGEVCGCRFLRKRVVAISRVSKWRPINYSFILVLIRPNILVCMSKIQMKSCFRMKVVGLIITKTK